MKILFITSSSINGGAQKHIRETFRCLSEMGNDVHIMAPEGWLLDELKIYKEKVIPMNASIKNVVKAERIIETIKPDITNTFILSGGCFGVAAWKRKKYGKIFITVNNPVVYDGISGIRKFLYPWLYRWMGKYASAFLVKAAQVSNEVADVIHNKKPVISIKNGIDFDVFDCKRDYLNIREEFGADNKDIVITNVAALEPRKGQKYLIKAVHELQKDYPVHLLLVGEGSIRDKLAEMVSDLGAEGYIHFLGRRSEINCILSNSDIFVLPSLHEGLPNALMEAMAMGLPCVSTDVGGARQLITDGVNGAIVNSKSSEELYDSIKAIMESDKLRKQYGDRACWKMAKEYRQDIVINELLQIYEKY